MCLGAGQTKAGKQYDKFRHFGLDKVKMEFAIFAIAFNIEKLYNKSPTKTLCCLKYEKRGCLAFETTSIEF